MREIKFRAWDEKINQFHYWSNELQKHDNIFWAMAKNNGMPISEFTGLRYKNVAEFYEGDIVKCGKGGDAPIAVICFDEQQFLLQYIPIKKNKMDNVFDTIDGYKHFQLLGNRYEHPHLLTIEFKKI